MTDASNGGLNALATNIGEILRLKVHPTFLPAGSAAGPGDEP